MFGDLGFGISGVRGLRFKLPAFGLRGLGFGGSGWSARG